MLEIMQMNVRRDVHLLQLCVEEEIELVHPSTVQPYRADA